LLKETLRLARLKKKSLLGLKPEELGSTNMSIGQPTLLLKPGLSFQIYSHQICKQLVK
jgi:hypothetical protein